MQLALAAMIATESEGVTKNLQYRTSSKPFERIMFGMKVSHESVTTVQLSKKYVFMN